MTNTFIKGAVVTAALATATIGLAVAPAQAATAPAHCDSISTQKVWRQDCTAPNEPLVAERYHTFMNKCKAQGGDSSEYSEGPTPRSDHWAATVQCYKGGGFR
jgi:hypothetical protein